MPEFKFDTHPGRSLHLLLFCNVTNCRELLQSMREGTLEPEISFMNASLVPDTFPILVAAHKTLMAQSRASLVTRTLHSELIYNYSGSKHITESLKRCGIAENISYILLARFDATPEEVEAAKKLVQGEEVSLEELDVRADKPQIQKHYKISSIELEVSSLTDAVTCRIAARDAL